MCIRDSTVGAPTSASLPGLAEVGAPTVTAIVGRAARFRTGKGVPLLYRAGAPGQRDRRDRPQGPADEQGRQPVAAHHPGPGRGPRPPGRPAARADLLHPDGRARRRAPGRPAASSPPTWPNGCMPSWSAACPTSSATPTALRSTRPPPRAIIVECWTVPLEVRARRRSRKPATSGGDRTTGKAPQQVLAGHERSDARGADERGGLPRRTSSAAIPEPVKRTPVAAAGLRSHPGRGGGYRSALD